MFNRTDDPYGCFSNFSKHPILVVTTWPTSEHYFQAQKFLDGELQFKILMEPSPMIAARMGRNRSWPLRPDWDDVRDDVMRTAIRAKVRQHHDVRDTLLSTGNAEIVEYTKSDSYWGDGGDGSGKNMLGRILMEVRDELTKDGPYDELGEMLLPPWLKYPEIERYSIGWRMGYGEGHLVDWSCWYEGLSPAGRETYRSKFPEPPEWEGYYDE